MTRYWQKCIHIFQSDFYGYLSIGHEFDRRYMGIFANTHASLADAAVLCQSHSIKQTRCRADLTCFVITILYTEVEVKALVPKKSKPLFPILRMVYKLSSALMKSYYSFAHATTAELAGGKFKHNWIFVIVAVIIIIIINNNIIVIIITIILYMYPYIPS